MTTEEKTLFGLSKEEVKTLLNHFKNDTNKIALALYNKGKAKSLNSGIKKAIRLKKFINS